MTSRRADPNFTSLADSSRNIRVSTYRYGQSGVADAIPGEEEYGKAVDPRRQLSYMPTHSTFYLLSTVRFCLIFASFS